ncbi:MAG: hypothetical protein MJZ20_06935 [Bacteroidaceae bacterium]|nr:hypothetical protein [Bacteroidaceae bacterium]
MWRVKEDHIKIGEHYSMTPSKEAIKAMRHYHVASKCSNVCAVGYSSEAKTVIFRDEDAGEFSLGYTLPEEVFLKYFWRR